MAYYLWIPRPVGLRIGSVRLGQVRLGQVKLGQVRLGQVKKAKGHRQVTFDVLIFLNFDALINLIDTFNVLMLCKFFDDLFGFRLSDFRSCDLFPLFLLTSYSNLRSIKNVKIQSTAMNRSPISSDQFRLSIVRNPINSATHQLLGNVYN